MFQFLKEKLKQTLGKISGDVEVQGKKEEVSKEVVEKEEKKQGFFSKLFARKGPAQEEPTREEKEAPGELFEPDEQVVADIKKEYSDIMKKQKASEKASEKSKLASTEKRPTAQDLVSEAIKLSEPKEKTTSASVLVEDLKDKDRIKKAKEDVVRLEKEVKDTVVKHEPPQVKKLVEDIKKVKTEVKELVEHKAAEHKAEELKTEVEKAKEELKQEEKLVPEEEATGFFGRLKQTIMTTKIDQAQFDKIFWDLELVLLENNVAVEVIDKIKKDLSGSLVDRPIRRGQVEDTISASLSRSLESLFDVTQLDILEMVVSKKPFVICFVGINGSGKTTTIAKFVKMFQDNGLKCVVAAADTFRAAAIQQLEEHATRLNVKLIKHDYGSDAAAVAFDAVKYAEAHKLDVVLIDTAGRMHSNTNLMDEMKKVVRVAKPDLKIFIGESITGNDCIEQASKFNEAIGIDGIVLSKADVDEKGGAAISVSYVTKKPILYLGIGQAYNDLQKFEPGKVIESLGL